MSSAEILVSLFGLFLGYWIISKLISGSGSVNKYTQHNEEKDFRSNPNSQTSDGPEWYEVLGVSPSASIEEIQAAYKSLIRQYHPDKVASLGEDLRFLAERKSKEINVAYKKAQDLKGGAS